ncbi:hypothetical protein E8E14_009907 [Neopestalotiopsis sp. 37M]|jgi:hypothetical protein|nr:hypothetical protein E8E14_009907 [Neopestalotiopsis sp. 37M]
MEDSEQPLASFPVELGAVGKGSEFRTQNASNEDWERRNVIERTRTGIHVYCDLMDVRHGTLGLASDGDFASIVVLRFRFDPQKRSRRVYRAVVKIEFLATEHDKEVPEVSVIAPEERWSLATSTDHEEVTNGGELSVGSGVSLVTATGTIKREQTTSRDISHATTVSGSINLGQGLNSGRETVARWLLVENESRSTGVPDSVRVAVLLRRNTDNPFNAIVTVEADADLATSLGKLFRKEPVDDPVLFDPKAENKQTARKERSHGIENLGSVNLYDLCDARIMGQRYKYSTDQN